MRTSTAIKLNNYSGNRIEEQKKKNINKTEIWYNFFFFDNNEKKKKVEKDKNV